MPDFTHCGQRAKYGIFRAMKRKPSKATLDAFQFGEAPKVLVSISLAHASWRDFFSGILRYVEEHANWDIRILQEPAARSCQEISVTAFLIAVFTSSHSAFTRTLGMASFSASAK